MTGRLYSQTRELYHNQCAYLIHKEEYVYVYNIRCMLLYVFFRASLTDFSGMVYWERLGPSNLETWKCDWGRACASTHPCDASGICFAKNFERSMRTLTPREGWLTCSWGQLLINKSCKKSLVKVPLKLPDVKIVTFCFFSNRSRILQHGAHQSP